MYVTHFGLREPPFNNTPDPRFFYATPEHEEALATLIYAISELKGYVLLTGEVGTGKTLITRLMLRRFGDRISSAVINNTCLDADDLLAAICSEFRLEVPASATRFERVRALQDHLLAEFAANRPVVLVLDEAQNLSHEAFEQLRMIGNLEADDAKLLQVVIAGQPELRERFQAKNMRQLKQRVFRSFHLSALTRDALAAYVRHRLKVAGLGNTPPAPGDVAGQQPPALLDDEALDLIHAFTGGLPRLINTVCDNAMLCSFAADRLAIDGPFMRTVIDQMTASDSPTPAPAPPASAVATETMEAEETAVQMDRRLQDRPSPAPSPERRNSPPPAEISTFAQHIDRLSQVCQEMSEQTQAAAQRVTGICQSADLSYARLANCASHVESAVNAITQRDAYRSQPSLERITPGREAAAAATPANRSPEKIMPPSKSATPRSSSDRFRSLIDRSRCSLDTLRELISDPLTQLPPTVPVFNGDDSLESAIAASRSSRSAMSDLHATESLSPTADLARRVQSLVHVVANYDPPM